MLWLRACCCGGCRARHAAHSCKAAAGDERGERGRGATALDAEVLQGEVLDVAKPSRGLATWRPADMFVVADSAREGGIVRFRIKLSLPTWFEHKTATRRETQKPEKSKSKKASGGPALVPAGKLM